MKSITIGQMMFWTAAMLSGQPMIHGPRVPERNTLPATCKAGELLLKSGDDPSRLLYVCATDNNWSQTAYAQGTVAQMPSICQTGQMYFATDAAPAGQNLFLCAAANTWKQTGGAQVNADWNAASGAAQILNKPTVTTTSTANAVVQRDASTDIYGGNLRASNQVLAPYGMSWGTRLYQGSIDSPNCSTGTLTLASETVLHKGLLSNQASCTVGLASPSYLGMLQMIVLCNGGTSATTTITWPMAVKGGFAAGGAVNQCQGQTFAWDGSAYRPIGAASGWY